MTKFEAGTQPPQEALPPTLNVAGRVRSVAAFAAADESQGRPLVCLVGGGFLTLVSLALIAYIAYHAVYRHATGTSGAMFWLGVAFFPYATGAFVFSLGYEFGDVGRALRLTLVILLTSVVFLAIASFALIFLVRPEAAASAIGSERGNALGIVSRMAGEEDKGLPPDDDMFTVTCGRCGVRYIPLPPDAACPECGWQAVTVGGIKSA